MPGWLRKYPPYRLYRYFTSPASRDVAMAKVHEIMKIPGKRRFLEAGLTTGESAEQLAGRCKTSKNIVSLFADLCWDIGPRLEDLGFMNELLRLDVLQPIGNPAANGAVTPLTSDEITLFGIAWKKKMPGVLKYLGTPRQEAAPSAEEGRLEVGRELHEQAIRGIFKGCCSTEDNGALETFLENFAAKETRQEQRHQPDGDMRRGVGGMSVSAGVLEAVKRVAEPDLKRQLAFQTGAVSNDPGSSPEQNNAGTGPDGFPIKLPAAEKKPPGGNAAQP